MKVVKVGSSHIDPAALYEEPKDVDIFHAAKKTNNIGKIMLISFVVCFNIGFWTIAINEYLLPAEDYLL
jgi:hypothetical protein